MTKPKTNIKNCVKFKIIFIIIMCLCTAIMGTVVAIALNNGEAIAQSVTLKKQYVVDSSFGLSDTREGWLYSTSKEGSQIVLAEEMTGDFEIDYRVIPKTKGIIDVSFVNFVFTDLDSGVNFTMRVSGKNTWGNDYIKVNAFYDVYALGRDQDKGGELTRDGATLRGSYDCSNVGGIIVGYDSAKKELYEMFDGARYTIFDLDGSFLPLEKKLGDFNRYSVKAVLNGIIAPRDTSRPANFVVYSVNGQNYCGESLSNNIGANSYAQASSNGVVNKPYVAPKAKMYDVIDGKIQEFDGEIKALDESGTDIYDSVSKSFTPDSEGEYKIIYKAKDASRVWGKEFILPINVVATSPEITTKVEGKIYSVVAPKSVVTIPAATSFCALEKSGKINTYIQIKKGANEVLQQRQLKAAFDFTFESLGEYDVNFIAIDYVGNKKITAIKVTVADVPLFVCGEVLPIVNAGKTITLPSATASFKGVNAPVSIKRLSPSGDISTGNQINVATSGDYTVEYSCVFGGKTYKIEKYFKAVVSPENMFTNIKNTSAVGNVDLPDYAVMGNGVKITGNGDGATTQITNMLDLEHNTKDDKLLEVIVTPKNVGQNEFIKLVVTLTDANNPDNYLTISFRRGQWDAGGKYIYSYVLAAANGGIMSARSTDVYEDGQPIIDNGYNTGSGVLSAFEGHAALGGKANPFSLYYDTSENALYTDSIDFKSKWLVLDFDDPKHVGGGKEWSGFSSGNVYMTLGFHECTSTSSSIIVTNVNGQSLKTDKITDNKAPSLSVDLAGNSVAPDGQQNKEYPIFSAVCSDEVDGIIQEITCNIYDPSGKIVEHGGNSFVPTKTGVYKIEYLASDYSGNKTSALVDVDIKFALDPITIEYAKEIVTQNCFVGQPIFLPKATFSGGAGHKSLEISVKNIKTSDVVVMQQNSYFTPMSAGAYELSYTATDFLGAIKPFTTTIMVTVNKKPIVTYPTIPQALLDGEKFIFPDFSAIDYYSDKAHPSSAKKSIIVNYNGVVTVLDASRSFTPNVASDGDNLTITYRAVSNSDSSQITEKTYSVKALKPNQLNDYFDYDKTIISAVYDKGFIEFVGGVAASGKTLTFVNPLPADDFEFSFDMNLQKSNMDSFKITLTDCVSSNIRLDFTFKKNANNAKTSYLQINDGRNIEIPGSFTSEVAQQLLLKFNNKNFTAYAYGDAEVGKATETAYGEKFNGFTSGKVYMTITLGNITAETGVRFKKLCNQAIFAKFKDGELLPFVDGIRPILDVSGSIPYFVSKGETVVVPKATAMDVLDPNATVTVSILDTQNKIIAGFNNASIAEDKSFVAAEYGSYIITYTALEKNNKSQKFRVAIKVVDEVPPTITIDGTVPTSGKVGVEIKLPGAVVQDNYDNDVTLYIIVTDPDGDMKIVPGAFTPSAKGSYYVKYFAKDSDYSYTIKDFVIIVA